MLRWVLGAVIALPCLLDFARADGQVGAPYSVRVCDKDRGCGYVEPSEAGYAAAARAPRTRTVRTQAAPAARAEVQSTAKEASRAPAPAVSGSTPWIAEARRYKGLTGAQLGVKHRGAWCGEFMGRVARASGLKTPGNPNMAPDWREAGTRISGPRVGAIALVNRGRGVGHVGIVTGVNESGDPIIISGNHNNRVVETAYPRGRIAAYVWPQG